MYYRITVKCSDKTYTIEATTFDVSQDLDKKSLGSSLLGGLEYWKWKDGLEDVPHEIIKTETSFNGEDWYTIENFIK